MFCGNLKTAIKLFKTIRLLRPPSLPCLPAGRAWHPRNDAHSVNKRTITSLRKNQKSFCVMRCFGGNLKATIKYSKQLDCFVRLRFPACRQAGLGVLAMTHTPAINERLRHCEKIRRAFVRGDVLRQSESSNQTIQIHLDCFS